MALDWSRGYSAKWRVRKVDEATWLPTTEVKGVDGATVKLATGDSAPLLTSGELELSGELEPGWHRIEMSAEQDGASALVAVATLLFEPDGAEWSRGFWGGSVAGRSSLCYAAERKFGPGAYAPKGVDGSKFAADLLRECIPAPVSTVGGFELSNHVVFDLGSSYLDGFWAVLDAAGWCAQVDGTGAVTVMPMPDEPSLTLGHGTLGLLMPDMKRSLPIDDVPNVVRVYEGSEMAEARNDDPDSPTSTVSRGREIQHVEDSPSRIDGETLRGCAERRLAELSDIYETIDIEREYAPDVLPYSAVRVALAEPGLYGDFRVMSQTITCGAGVRVGETLGRRSR